MTTPPRVTLESIQNDIGTRIEEITNEVREGHVFLPNGTLRALSPKKFVLAWDHKDWRFTILWVGFLQKVRHVQLCGVDPDHLIHFPPAKAWWRYVGIAAIYATGRGWLDHGGVAYSGHKQLKLF